MIFFLGIIFIGFCIFEDRIYCGYEQDICDDFQWIWKSSRIIFIGIGFFNDYIYGIILGMYI